MPAPALLKNRLIDDNALGIKIYEPERVIDGYLSWKPTFGRAVFMHGRDALKHSAQFDDGGILIIPRDENQNPVEPSPFTEKAFKAVDALYSYDSFPERKAAIAATATSRKEIEALVAQKVDEALSTTQASDLLHAAIDRHNANTAKMDSDPAAEAKRTLDKFRQAFADMPEINAMLAELADAYMRHDFLKDMPNPVQGDGTVDLDKLEQLMTGFFAYVAAHKNPDADFSVWEDIKDDIITLYHDKMGGSYLNVVTAIHAMQIEALSEIYETRAAAGEWEARARNTLEDNQLSIADVDYLMKELAHYQFDPEQTLNVCEGIYATGDVDFHSVAELIETGRHIRTSHRLAGLAANMGNPFEGRVFEEEKRAVEEIVDAVPMHIMHQACKDGATLEVAIGDPAKNKDYVAASRVTKGNYSFAIHDHPNFTIVRDIKEDKDTPETTRTMGQLARHEYRHYWGDRLEMYPSDALKVAAESDRKTFGAIKDAISAASPDDEQQRIIEHTMQVTGMPAIDNLRKVLDRIEANNKDWIDVTVPQTEDEIMAARRKYSSDVYKREEVFSRVDEVVMDFGDAVARHFFPASYDLMQAMDAEFIKTYKLNRLPEKLRHEKSDKGPQR